MTLSKDRSDREYQKFDLNSDNKTAVRTLSEITNQIEGEFVFSGLKTGGRITTILVGDVAIALPSSPLANRNAIAIRNLSETDILYIGFDNLIQANDNVGTSAGWKVEAGENLQFDITDAVVIYGIMETGITAKIQIMELA